MSAGLEACLSPCQVQLYRQVHSSLIQLTSETLFLNPVALAFIFMLLHSFM